MNTILARDMVRDYTSEYAVYVAQDRALCSLMDGLKPVQRRCINSADDLKLYHNKKHLKVSKLSGQVLGDYHPHGGANPVLMAQPFRFRYPIFEGQGNYGSSDSPNSYAAARYLEIRLSKFAEDFYLDSADCADIEDNYDGRLKEKTLYYPALPGCLFTGASGIAVGFSTEVPAHTITSIGNSLLKYIKNKDSTEYLEGLHPETCEKSIILTSPADIKQLYRTGEGSIKYKAATHYETVNGKPALVVDAFPPGFSKKRLDTPSIMESVDKGLLEVSNESSEELRYVFVSPDIHILKELEDRLTSSVGYRMYIEHRGVIKLYKLSEIYDTFIEEKSAFIIRKYEGIVKDLNVENEYLRVLLALKSDKQYIKDMFDKDSDTVVNDITERYDTTSTIAKRVISTTLRNLMADNMDAILKKMESINASIFEYEDYVRNPLGKILLDINNILGAYEGEESRAVLQETDSMSISLEYRGSTIEVSKESRYFIGDKNNEVRCVYGEDLLSNIGNIDDYCIAKCDKPFYFLYDSKGCCGMMRESLELGNKFNSKELKGIIGVNDWVDITIKQGNGKVYKGVSWSQRKKLSYIRLSAEGEPDFEILTTHEV